MLDAEAQSAATHWNGKPICLIRNRENAVFRMALPGGGQAAMRMHRAGYQGEAAIRAELWWCGALAEAGLPVPRPLPTLAGDLLARGATGRLVSAIQWLPGVHLGEAGVPLAGDGAQQALRHHALGRLIAQIHTATDALILPAPFLRPQWDIDGLTGETPFWGRFWQHPALTRAEARTLHAARQFVRAALQDHAPAADFGAIHADVLRENVLVQGDALSLIDFDDSGTGFRLYDLGTVLSQNLYEPHFPEIRAALIEGYASLRPVAAGMVDTFTLARTLASVGWTMPRLASDDPTHRSHIDRALMWAGRVMA